MTPSSVADNLKLVTVKLSVSWLMYWFLVNGMTRAQASLDCPTPQPTESFCMAMDPPPGNYTLQTTICKQFLIYRWINRTLLTIVVLGRQKYMIKLAMIQVRVNDTPVGTYEDRKGLNHLSCPPGNRNVAYFCNMRNPYFNVIARWLVPNDLANVNFTCRIHVTLVCNNGFWKMTDNVVPFHEFKWEMPPNPTMRYLN